CCGSSGLTWRRGANDATSSSCSPSRRGPSPRFMAQASCTAATPHISMVEYWRWGGGPLWVESFFEVFATTVIAFLFARLGLLSAGLAAQASLLAGTLYLAGGIIGTNHHLYFSGTPTAALAWGATFSALEVVPLVLIGYQAMKDLRISRRTEWARK